MNKKKLTSLSLSLALTAGLFSGITVQAQQYYPDVDEGHWAYEWVGYMNEHGYIHGYPDGNYRPAQNITRAEYVTILNYIFESKDTTDKNYVDVKDGDWYYGQIHAAVAAGYLHGYDDATETDDGTMKPNNFITREEAAVVVADAYGLVHNSDVSKFSDADQISSWAVPYVGALAGDEVLMGDADTANFRPKDHMLRAEVASMIAQAEIKKEEGSLTQEEKVTLPESLSETEGTYTLKDIGTKNIPIEKTLTLSIDISESGDVGAYKITAAIDGVIFADGVTPEGLQAALKDKVFTADELEKLTISFAGFENPADGSSLTLTAKVSDSATGEKIYDTKEYVIAFGEQTLTWPAKLSENSKYSHSLSGISTDYAKDAILEVSEKITGSVGSYTLSATIDGTEIAKDVTLEELSKILAEKKFTAQDINSLKIDVKASSPANGSSLELTFKFVDAETKETIGSEKTYVINYRSTGGGSITGGGGSSTTPVSSTRDRVVESLQDYQNNLTNASSNKQIANDYKNHRVSTDMLKVILTNDGMNTFDSAVSQVKDASKVDSVFNTIKESLGDSVAGSSCFDYLYPVYEDVIKHVLSDTSLNYKDVDIDLYEKVAADASKVTKDKYVLLFRAMVATINGSADAAIKVYNDPANAALSNTEKFDKFKNEAINNTTSVLNNILNSSDVTFDTDEKLNIISSATAYVNDLFDANKGNASLKDDLAAAGELNLSNFSTILKKYI